MRKLRLRAALLNGLPAESLKTSPPLTASLTLPAPFTESGVVSWTDGLGKEGEKGEPAIEGFLGEQYLRRDGILTDVMVTHGEMTTSLLCPRRTHN